MLPQPTMSFRLFSPVYETESVDIAMELPLDGGGVLEYLREVATGVTADWLTDAVFTTPLRPSSMMTLAP